jgi:hypothetical protein
VSGLSLTFFSTLSLFRTKRTTRTGTIIKWSTKTSVMRTKWLKWTKCKPTCIHTRWFRSLMPGAHCNVEKPQIDSQSTPPSITIPQRNIWYQCRVSLSLSLLPYLSSYI